MGKTIGIDLGTTNSAVSVMEGREFKVIDNQEGNGTTPSIVAITEDGILVGEAAKNQAVTNSENTFFAVKRLIGRRFNDPEVQKMAQTAPFKIVEAENGDAWVQAGDKKYAPAQISAEVLKYMKQAAEDYLGEEVTDAVITVPAYFDDSQRQATKDAGKIAGLEVKRIVNEPTAAALAYGVKGATDEDRNIAVYDLGGGTYDISILEIGRDEDGDTVYTVKSTQGDTFLGGEDFDHRVMDHLIDEFKTQSGIDLRAAQKDTAATQALQRIKDAAEKAKVELSGKEQTTINLPYLSMDESGPKHLETKLSRAKLESLAEDLIERTKAPMEQALKDAGLKAGDIDEVILVGGMTRMPKVREAVNDYFGKEPNKKLNPDKAVSAGAAIQGGIISGEVDNVMLLDVIPLTIGIETLGGVMAPMIRRNTAIPFSYKETFSTAEDSQTAVTVRVYQGESDMIDRNKLLGEFNLVGIPPAPRGVPKISVEFNIDANSILNVAAKDLGTGREQKIQVQANGGLSESEVERMIEEAAQNAESDKARKDAIVLRNEAESAVNATRKTIEEYGDLVPDAKTELEEAAKALEEALADEATDTQTLKTQMEALQQSALDFGQKLYETHAPADEEGYEDDEAEDSAENNEADQTDDKPEPPQNKNPQNGPNGP